MMGGVVCEGVSVVMVGSVVWTGKSRGSEKCDWQDKGDKESGEVKSVYRETKKKMIKVFTAIFSALS